MNILVTGGAGFIGTNFVIDWLGGEAEPVINIDKLTYAGNRGNLASLDARDDHRFVHGDICDAELLSEIFSCHDIRAVVHFAAESHVDRSIHGPEDFVNANVVGTFRLLEAARHSWLTKSDCQERRFIHVSTDEVYGSLNPLDPAFTEATAYQPNSPYSASKAAADHFARAYFETYGLPVIITNCSNNYGPYHFPEKLIPLVIHNALAGKPLPIYGDGNQVRDWLYVGDHCSAIRSVLRGGRIGEKYNIGGGSELRNIEVVQTICQILDRERPRSDGCPYSEQITYVKDRPGHDRRYAIDTAKLQRELGWRPSETFETGIERTIQWYLHNTKWVEDVTSGAYLNWVAKQYT